MFNPPSSDLTGSAFGYGGVPMAMEGATFHCLGCGVHTAGKAAPTNGGTSANLYCKAAGGGCGRRHNSSNDNWAAVVRFPTVPEAELALEGQVAQCVACQQLQLMLQRQQG